MPDRIVGDALTHMRRIAWIVRWGLILEGLYMGLGYMFGPDSWFMTPSYLNMAAAAPMWVWGFLITATSVLLLVPRWRWYGYAAGTAVWALATIPFIVSVPVTSGWGGPATFGFTALMHWVGASWTGSPFRGRFLIALKKRTRG